MVGVVEENDKGIKNIQLCPKSSEKMDIPIPEVQRTPARFNNRDLLRAILQSCTKSAKQEMLKFWILQEESFKLYLK